MSDSNTKSTAELYSELAELQEKVQLISSQILSKGSHEGQGDFTIVSNTKCRLCTSLTPNSILVIDNKGSILESNPAFFNLTGYSPQELIGKSIDLFVTPIPRNENSNSFFHGNLNCLLKVKSGIYIDVSIQINRLTDGGNIVFIQNITKIVESKNQLRQTLRYAENIFSSIFSGLFIYELNNDNQLILVDGNAAAENIFNTALEDIIGTEFEEVWPCSIQDDFKDKIIDVSKTGRSFYEEEAYFVEDEMVHIFQINAFEVDHNQICVSFNEITEQKQVEAKLHYSQHKLKIQNKISSAFMFEESDRLYSVIINILLEDFSSHFAFIGCVQEGVGLACLSRKSDDTNETGNNFILPKSSWTGIWEEALVDGKSILQNKNFICSDAGIDCERFMVAPVISERKLLGVIFIANSDKAYTKDQLDFFSKISEHLAPIFRAKQEQEKRHLANEELVIEKNKVEAINKAKDEFLAVMSHEVRTPLNPIIGFSKLLLDETEDEGLKGYLSIIHSSGERLLKLIEDIFSLTKLTQGEIKANLQKIEFQDFLDECLQFSSAIENRNTLVFENKIEGCEFVTPELSIKTDYNLLSQIMRNLMNNACKYTNNGKIILRAGTKLRRKNQLIVRIEIEDNGIGIEEGLIDSLFDPFTQEESSFTRRFEGAGLGLAICKKLIEVLEGEIGAISQKGNGSTFWLEFPAEFEEEMDVRTDINYPYSKFPVPYEILVAEDIIDNQELVRTYIEKLAGKATIAEDGLEVLSIASQRKFDLILMDLSMPFMDGFTATEKLISEEGPNQNTPIVALSAHVSEKIIRDCKNVGMVDYISKPLTQEVLFDIIMKVLN